MSEVSFNYKIVLDVADGVGDVRAKQRGSGDGGWLMAFAEAMGRLMEKQVNEIEKFSKSIGDKPTPEDSTKLTAMTQMFQMFMNAVSTALKSMGEGAAGMARKQ